jgi:hypothetical protein
MSNRRAKDRSKAMKGKPLKNRIICQALKNPPQKGVDFFYTL